MSGSLSSRAKYEVIIAGGGVAGIAAGLELAQRGVRVCLIEAKRRLGGRATSFVDVGTGQTLDNCQHVVLGCCTEYIGLCKRLGVVDQFDWYPEQYWVEEGGRTNVLAPGKLPAPLHYAGAFAKAGFLTLAEKAAIARGMVHIRLSSREMYRDITFGQYLAIAEQPQSAIAKFWQVIIVSACNLAVERVCAAVALKVFQDGFMAGKGAGLMGVPKVPLVRLYDRASEIIRESRGEVLLGTSVESLDGRGVRVVGGEHMKAGHVICALPVERAQGLARLDNGDERLACISRAHGEGPVEFSPILGVHLEFDRPIMLVPHAVLVGRPTQWLFRKDAAGRRVHAVISAADSWMELDEGEILGRVVEDVCACFDSANDAKLLWGRAVKERRATFASTPAFEAVRENIVAAPPRNNGVVLAGDYTNTGWPATMEGAARSGLAAARVVLSK